MIEYFAGRYFLQNGILTQEHLTKILGHLAIVEDHIDIVEAQNSDILTNNQKAFIQLLQNSLDDKLYDLASEYDGITEEQTKSIVRKQSALNAVFFSHLIKTNVIKAEELSSHLENMRNYYALNKPGMSRNLKVTFDFILGTFIDSQDYYANEYAAIALKYILRFVGTKMRFTKATPLFSYYNERIIVQKLVTEETRYFIGIAGEKLVLQSFNDCITGTFAAARTDVRYGSLFSFVSCITNILQCLIARDKEVKLVSAPDVFKYSTLSSNERCYLIPFKVEDYKIDLIIGYGTKPNFATINHNI